MDLLIPGFEILNQIGVGGMAEVFRARQISLDRDVALKIMLEQLAKNAAFCERFIREAKIAAKINHPNIIQIFDVDQYQDQLFLSMEYVDGGDLVFKRNFLQSYADILTILVELTSALDFAHSLGYIHRDIKPANILFRKNGSLVITDFGIARAIHSDTNLTVAGSMMGTPNYMSPEQAQALELDGRSDLYSVAVIAYQLLTGELPYSGNSTISIAVKHVSYPLPVLDDHLQPLQTFFNKALAKNPDERFANGAQMMESLAPCVSNLNPSTFPTYIKQTAVADGDSSLTEVNYDSKGITAVTYLRTPTITSTIDPTEYHPYSGRENVVSDTGSEKTGSEKIGSEKIASSIRPAGLKQIWQIVYKAQKNKVVFWRVVFAAAMLLFVAVNIYVLLQKPPTPTSADEVSAISDSTSTIISDTIPNTTAMEQPLEEEPEMELRDEEGDTPTELDEVVLQNSVPPPSESDSSPVGAQEWEQAEEQTELEQNDEPKSSPPFTALFTHTGPSKAEQFLAVAEDRFARGILLGKQQNDAYYYYQQVLMLDPNNVAAKAGIDKIKAQTTDQIRANIKNRKLELAKQSLQQLVDIDPDYSEIKPLRTELAQIEKQIKLQQR